MVTDIPELRHYIALYLDFGTLKAFSLVCKEWYLDARPILWCRFSCVVPPKCSESPEEYAVWLETIRKNAISFRRIYYFGYNDHSKPEICDVLLGRCHSLVSIEMLLASGNLRNDWRCWEEKLRPLVEQNKASLRQLHLRVIQDILMTSLQLQNLLASLPHLRSLELFAPSIVIEDLLPILDACPRSLERLNLLSTLLRRKELDQGNSVNFPSQTSIISTATSLRLKQLRMEYPCYHNTLEDILSRLAVHNLEELQVYVTGPLLMSPTIRDALWRLTRLHLREMSPVIERALPGILDSIHPHQLRHVNLGSMDTRNIMTLIEQQHQSLESLSIHFMDGHEGALAEIMTTCVSLRSLNFSTQPFVNIRTLIDAQKPWVCTRLEVFEGCFGLSPPRPLASSDFNDNLGAMLAKQFEKLFMRRLGRLTNLRSIVQKRKPERQYFYDPVSRKWMEKRVMRWSLDSGLVHLQGLVNLQTFKVLDRGMPTGMGVPEMMFIKQHWRSLKELACSDVGGVDVQEWLANEWPELKVSMS